MRKLGQGAIGEVFEIQRDMCGIQAKSALKIIKIPNSDDDIRRVLSEGMAEESLSGYYQQVAQEVLGEVGTMMKLKSHENIVGCEDFLFIPNEDEIGGHVLIRMELMQSLRDYQLKHQMDEVEVRLWVQKFAVPYYFIMKMG